MPDLTLTPEKIEREFEAWRDCTLDLDGSGWFSVRHVGNTCFVSIFGAINFGEDWQRLGDEIGDSQDIRLLVNSHGGDSSFAHLWADSYGDGRTTECRIVEKAFSAAAMIALSARKVLMRRDAQLMLHEPVSFAYGTAKEFEARAASLKKSQERFFQVVKVRTELPDETINGWFGGADTYFSAEQCLAYGLCNEIYDYEPPKSSPVVEPVAATGAPVEKSALVQSDEPTSDERFFHDLLRAVGNLKIRNRQKFIHELISWGTYATSEEKIDL